MKCKKVIALMISAVMIFTFSSCSLSDDEDPEQSDKVGSTVISNGNNAQSDVEITNTISRRGRPATTYSDGDTWAVYWYLCGSDLESDGGAATDDIYEMLDVDLPENVKVVIQTGGTNEWQNDVISSDSLGRYLYSSDGFEEIETKPIANMGDPSTFADFLSFCKTNYPADHTAVVFWNHGGGSVTGAAFDELYDYDSLTLTELSGVLSSVYSENDPYIELIGFDTCLMSTIETAAVFCEYANYLVASEELEPGNGWNYTGWLSALGENTGMNGAELGKIICDTFVEGCEEYGTDDEITLAVTDLSKLDPLLVAYDNIGREALSSACNNVTFFSTFGRAASKAENYGGNSKEEGYTNMVDMGDLVINAKDILPENAQSVINALNDCIVYKVNGPYRPNATGLSCYYSYDGDRDVFNEYNEIGASQAFKYYFDYLLNGTVPNEALSYLSTSTNEITGEAVTPIEVNVTPEDYQSFSEQLNASGIDLEDYPVYINDNGYGTLDLGAEIADMLCDVYFELCYIDAEEDICIALGRDNDISSDWENGVFEDNFRGVWGAIDGCLVYMELIETGDDFNLYSVPILLNGEDYNLRVTYNYDSEDFEIIGARKAIDDTGMADKNLRKLKVGDEISTIHYIASFSGDDEYEEYVIDTFNVTENTAFTEEELGDGEYVMFFEMIDAAGESSYSSPLYFDIEDGEIYAETD